MKPMLYYTAFSLTFKFTIFNLVYSSLDLLEKSRKISKIKKNEIKCGFWCSKNSKRPYDFTTTDAMNWFDGENELWRNTDDSVAHCSVVRMLYVCVSGLVVNNRLRCARINVIRTWTLDWIRKNGVHAGSGIQKFWNFSQMNIGYSG